jgi:uncharacterized protein (DUF305 family)
MNHSPYRRLLLMSVLSFVAMYLLMYAMVDAFSNVYANFNQAYMAGLMTAPMILIELASMHSMYPRREWNIGIGVGALAGLLVCWGLIRQQAAIGDEQFLKSMIPHHASAILMCHEASIEDPEIEDLCRSISSGQQAEIDQMKAILERLQD